MKSLADLSVGESATVLEISGGDSLTVRILEMGVTPGEAVSVIGAAPLGDPIEVRIRDYRLSLRKSEAERIMISPSNVDAPSS